MRARAFAKALFSLFVALPLVAYAQDSVFIEDLTSPELQALVHGGRTIALVPIGGTEQNGPHMTLGKHNVRVKALAEKIARALGNALVAPVLAYVPEGGIDPPTAHMRFPGTLTVPPPVFEATLESIARSLRRAGFRDVVLIGDHGDYRVSMKHVADRLDREWAASPVRVHALDAYYEAAAVEFPASLKAQGFGDAEIGTHAGLWDTALALALDPQLVRVPQLRERRLGPADGVHGDPSRASAELGQRGVDLIVSRSIAAIRRAQSRP